MKTKWNRAGFFVFLPLLTACDPKNDTCNFVEQNIPVLKPALDSLYSKLYPSEKPNASEVGGEPTQSATVEMAKANSELLSEMMKVTFNVEAIDDKSNFGELAHTLNAGASLEGIYRGVVMGSRYRGLEAKSQAASPTVLKAFATEMAEIQDQMNEPTEFSKADAKGVSIDFPEGGPSDGVDTGPQGPPNPAVSPAATPISAIPPVHSQEVKPKRDKKEVATRLLETFIGSSPYTLKRILADEAMKKMEEVKESPGELSQWYAKFTLQMISTGIDFGLKQRNDADFDFHFKFAKNMASDRVRWEVVNRCHRYLNASIHLDQQR